LKLQKLLDAYKPNNLLVWLEADIDGEPSLHNVVFLTPPKYMELNRNPGIKYRINRSKDGSYKIEISSLKVALWTWLELDGIDAKLSNNFFHLRPGVFEKIQIRPGCKLTSLQLTKSLIVKSIVDTY